MPSTILTLLILRHSSPPLLLSGAGVVREVWPELKRACPSLALQPDGPRSRAVPEVRAQREGVRPRGDLRSDRSRMGQADYLRSLDQEGHPIDQVPLSTRKEAEA